MGFLEHVQVGLKACTRRNSSTVAAPCMRPSKICFPLYFSAPMPTMRSVSSATDFPRSTSPDDVPALEADRKVLDTSCSSLRPQSRTSAESRELSQRGVCHYLTTVEMANLGQCPRTPGFADHFPENCLCQSCKR